MDAANSMFWHRGWCQACWREMAASGTVET